MVAAEHRRRATVLSALLLLSGCAHIAFGDAYEEAWYPFFDLDGREPTRSKWVQDPENLLRVHETFRARGYACIVSDPDDDGVLVGDHAIHRSIRQLVAELNGCAAGDCSPHASAYWRRRHAQGNTDAVALILREVHEALNGGIKRPLDRSRMIPELSALLELRCGSLPVEEVVERLVVLGLHQSAANVLSGQRYGYAPLPLGRLPRRDRVLDGGGSGNRPSEDSSREWKHSGMGPRRTCACASR